MRLFGRRRGSTDGPGGSRRAEREAFTALSGFVESRRGVEAYVEPQTSFSATTVVLVAADGQSMRRQVSSAHAAADFARNAAIPIYDVNRVGYPQRLRDYAVRQHVSQPRGSGPYLQRGLTPAERQALVTLAIAAGVVEQSGLSAPGAVRPNPQVLKDWRKRARARCHPDRLGGDRSEWDDVEQAARVLGLD